MLDDRKTTCFQEGFENFSSTSSEIISYKPSEEIKEYEILGKELSASRSQYTKIRDILHKDDLKNQEYIQEIQKISDHTDHIEEDRERSIIGMIDHQKIKKSKSDIIDKILKVTCEKLKAQNASIFLISKDGVLERAGIYGRDINQEEIENKWLSEERYKISDSFFTGKAAQPRENSSYGAIQYTEVFRGRNEEENLIFEQYYKKLGDLKSAIAIPLSGRNKTYGVLRIINSTDSSIPGIFPIEDCNFRLDLTTLSTSIASRLSYFRRDVQSSLLEYFSHLLIQSTCDTEEIYQKILDSLVQNPETAFKAAILRVKIQDNLLRVKAKSLFPGVDLNRDDQDRRENERSFLSSVVLGKRRLIVQDIQSLINTDGEVSKEDHPFKNDQWIKENNFQCFACFPLMTKENEIQGTLSLYTGYNYEFHADSIRFLQGMVDQLSAFIFRLKLEKQKRDLEATISGNYPLSISQKNEARFNALAAKWKVDTQTSLLMTQKCTDPSYQRIIGMGQQILPLLLNKISEPSGEDWFWALSAITDENPIKLEHRGIIDKITEDWIKWGRSQGYEC
jgi:GAF domain-containing protein